ncbi:Precorrin-6A reductase [compost metagenome]
MTARGPFELDEEIAMLRDNHIDVIVCKNSGGAAAYGKIEAARRLSIPVVMIDRPPHPCAVTVPDIEAVLTTIRHQLSLLENRGE